MPRSKNKQSSPVVDEPIKSRRDDAQWRCEMAVNDPFNLERFVTAQASIFETALSELKAGRKHSHWMWFIFPQLRGLGHSSNATFYGIGSLAEARAYLAHRLLGPRLLLCTETVLGVGERSLYAIFGSPDDIKFCSSMTLFALACFQGENAFRQALDRYCGSRMDERTLVLLETDAS
jgi:uncharacterized protein (DUF1810 family)